jgi:hypothetical protein
MSNASIRSDTMNTPEQRLFTEPNEDEPDDALDVWLDGEVIMTVTYNGLGYDGMKAIKELVEKIQIAM